MLNIFIYGYEIKIINSTTPQPHSLENPPVVSTERSSYTSTNKHSEAVSDIKKKTTKNIRQPSVHISSDDSNSDEQFSKKDILLAVFGKKLRQTKQVDKSIFQFKKRGVQTKKLNRSSNNIPKTILSNIALQKDRKRKKNSKLSVAEF
ncbi:hypothetical protein CDIK_2052 [Cucumispora dikerogammari]|nr:hypothetical protein CDIK_2052 [Cucumispora dikerogammari]